MIINSQKLKQAILSALADEEIVKILNCSMCRAIPVNNIIKECNIPHTTAYRKINWLLDKGLLLIDKNDLDAAEKLTERFLSLK